jgi:hypothetical protein
MKRSNTVLGIVCIGLLCTFGACGGSASTNKGNVRPPARPIPPQFVKPACFWAGTTVGEEPGRIDFIVRCRPRSPKSHPAFGVGRYSLAGKSARPGFRHVDHHPTVTGPGASRPYGSCARSGSVIYCAARSQGAVAVKGSIWVTPSTECKMGVSVTVPIVRRCEDGEECYAQGGEQQLVGGRPEGCG